MGRGNHPYKKKDRIKMVLQTLAILFYGVGLAHHICTVLNDILGMCSKNRK